MDKSAKELVIEQQPRRSTYGTHYSSDTERLLWDALTICEQERGFFTPVTNVVRQAWAAAAREDIRIAITMQFAGDDSAYV